MIRVFPGEYDELGEGYEVDQIFITKEYQFAQDPENDYALIKLKKKVERERYLSLNTNFNPESEKEPVLAIHGYPGINYAMTSLGVSRHFQSGMIKEGRELLMFTNSAMIKHFISTSSGHSGSPILFMSDENGPSVIELIKDQI